MIMAEEKKNIPFALIGNALRSAAADGVTAFADEVFDTERQKYQDEVISDIETKIEDETARAKAAEESNATAIEAEEEARSLAISQEAQARTQADEQLSQGIVSEKDRAEAREQELTAAIQQETERAIAAEEANATAIIGTERIADGAVTVDKFHDEIKDVIEGFRYDDNPEYIYVKKDADGNLLWWIGKDAKIGWSKGVPEPIQEQLRILESLISENAAGIEQLETKGTELSERIKENASAIAVVNAALDKKMNGEYDDNPEYIYVMKDSHGNVLCSINNDGVNHMPRLNTETFSIKGKPIDGDAIESVKYDDNPEFMHVIKDSTGNLLQAINVNGRTIVENDLLKKMEGDITYLQEDFATKAEYFEGGMAELADKTKDLEHNVLSLTNRINTIVNKDYVYPIISAVLPCEGCYSMNVDKNKLYVGSRNKVYMYDISVESNPILIGSSADLAAGYILRSISIKNEYLYVVTRGNGSGMDNEIKYPLFLASFEMGLEDLSTEHDSFDNYITDGNAYINETGDPCPSRWAHSAKLYKGTGSSYAKLVRDTEIGDVFYMSLWVRSDNSNSSNIYIPIMFRNNTDVISIIIGSDKKLGLLVNGTDYFGDYVLGSEWASLKVTYKDSSLGLFARGKECDAIWTEVLTETVTSLDANQIGLGIESESTDVTLYLDEYCYDVVDLDTVTNINGCISILNKNDLSIIKEYKLNLRGLSSFIDGNNLFVGMIGGMNIYDISEGTSLKLLGFNRDSSRKSTYPKGESNYKITVPFAELQGMYMYSLEGSDYVVAGNDTRGATIYNVSDVGNPYIVKEIFDVPFVPCIEKSTGVRKTYPQYVEWDVYCEYPYVYSTVAALHSFRNGAYTLVNDDDLVFGLKVRDISDLENITSTIVRIDKDDYTDFLITDGDSRPVSMSIIGDKIIMANGSAGVSIFKKGNMLSSYIKTQRMLYGSRLFKVLCAHDGRVFAGDYTNSPEKNVYLLRGIL